MCAYGFIGINIIITRVFYLDKQLSRFCVVLKKGK